MEQKYFQKLLRQDSFLTPQEVKKLLKAIDRRYFLGVRDYAVIKTFLSCGLRKSELQNLRVEHYQKAPGYAWMIVKGKGGQELDQVFNSKTTIAAIDKYLKMSGHGNDGNAPLFQSIGKHKVSNGLILCRISIDYMLKKYARKAGMSKNIHCHMLRHTFGTEIYKATKDVITTQFAMRHKDGGSTLIYLHSDKDRILEGLKQAGI